jgi:hypothetical protein
MKIYDNQSLHLSQDRICRDQPMNHSRAEFFMLLDAIELRLRRQVRLISRVSSKEQQAILWHFELL